jgi:glycerol-3-phosphate dehydrogenase (NAD(P)+)
MLCTWPTRCCRITFRITHELGEALTGATLIVIAVPSHGCPWCPAAGLPLPRSVKAIVVSATKGLEQETHYRRVREVIDQEVGPVRIGCAVGTELRHRSGQGTADGGLGASSDTTVVETLLREFRAPYFRLYGTTDVVGVEIGGAMKNVIAIAGRRGRRPRSWPQRARRPDHSRPRRDRPAGMRRRCAARDMAGLTGLGDLVLTCTGALSRNRHVGMELARGRSLSDVLAGMKMVAEGVRTTEAALALGRPLRSGTADHRQVAELLAGRKDAALRSTTLMLRPQRAEVG